MGVVERHSLLESPKGIICWSPRRKRTDYFSSLFASTKLLQQTLEEKWKRRGEQKDVCVVPSFETGWIQYLYSGLHSFVTRVLGHPASPSVLHRLRANSWHVTFIQAKHPYTFFKKRKKRVIFLKTVTGSFYTWRWVWMEAPCGLWLGRSSQRPVQMWSREGCWRLRKDEGSRH